MKLVSSRAAHKSDVGGVVLGVASAAEAERAFTRLIEVGHGLGDPDSCVLITPMISRGVECFVGAKNDPQFGPVIFFGAGGVLVEVLRDVTCKLAPLDDDEAHALIARTKIARLLAGYRGAVAADRAALARLIASLSRYVAGASNLVELDLNPVIVNGTGAHVADARMVVR
jgi:acetate---CoA ligase (ADP-forming)